MAKLTDAERALAERIGGGTVDDDTERMRSAVAFVRERRERPTLSLHEWPLPADDETETRKSGPNELRGRALTEALREAGLSTRGTAAEKRARLRAGE